MKTKQLSMLAVALLVSGAMAPVALAQGVGVRVQATTTVNAGTRGNATSTEARARGESDTEATASLRGGGNATSTSANAKGQLTAEAHRSTVASFVRSLLAIADREGGIGTQVRLVAQSQNESASTSARAMTNVEGRGKFQTFLFGTDYASIGELRSQMVTTQNNIEQLKRLRDQSADASVKADLDAQLTVLEESRAEIEAFVRAHEGSFSLLGWFVKFFVR